MDDFFQEDEDDDLFRELAISNSRGFVIKEEVFPQLKDVKEKQTSYSTTVTTTTTSVDLSWGVDCEDDMDLMNMELPVLETNKGNDDLTFQLYHLVFHIYST